MSDAPILTFDAPSKLGKVVSVDTSRVLIAVENAALLPRAAVGSLVAIQGTTAQEFLIGMTERVTRQLREQTAQPDPMAPTTLAVEVVPDDALRAVLLGTYRTIEGTVHNRFKRGADSFPQIDRDCFLIEGGNLQRFMGLLGKDLDEKQRLELGHFVIDRSAAAIANGDRLFPEARGDPRQYRLGQELRGVVDLGTCIRPQAREHHRVRHARRVRLAREPARP